ncbi:MAG: transposase [Candidatus Omnitrophota bacterium]|nr:transposase [Candidatus Omnitrophota bacterium]
MARPYRLEAENTLYHLTNRGDDRKKIYASELDRKKFLEYVVKAKKRFKFRLYAYVLMTNHYHLLIETLQANLSKIMHFINSSYTTYYNVKRKKTGHLFQGRYKSIIADKDNYFLELTRYIHLNPVKAAIVKLPEEYKWSSYKAYTGMANDKYIDKEAIKAITDLWGKRYRNFVMASIDEKINPFKNIYGGILLGNKIFIKEKLKKIKEQVNRGKHVAYQNALTGCVEKEEILKLIKKEYGKNVEELKVRARRSNIRKIAIYLMKELTALTNNEIGNIFDMKYSAVSKAALGVENEMRENKELKKEVEKLISNFEA